MGLIYEPRQEEQKTLGNFMAQFQTVRVDEEKTDDQGMNPRHLRSDLDGEGRKDIQFRCRDLFAMFGHRSH